MNKIKSNSQIKKIYDLEERTARYAESIIDFVKRLKITVINKRLVEQLVRSAGSIGANYCEANESESRRDFIHKVSIAKKEAKETKHWLRLLAKADFSYRGEVKKLQREGQELLLIFSKIITSSRKK